MCLASISRFNSFKVRKEKKMIFLDSKLSVQLNTSHFNLYISMTFYGKHYIFYANKGMAEIFRVKLLKIMKLNYRLHIHFIEFAIKLKK